MKKFITGAIIGGAVSAVASILLTPKKGSEVRSEAGVKYQELKTKTTELIQKVKEKTKEQKEVTAETTENTEVEVISETEETENTEEKEEKIS